MFEADGKYTNENVVCKWIKNNHSAYFWRLQWNILKKQANHQKIPVLPLSYPSSPNIMVIALLKMGRKRG